MKAPEVNCYICKKNVKETDTIKLDGRICCVKHRGVNNEVTQAYLKDNLQDPDKK